MIDDWYKIYVHLFCIRHILVQYLKQGRFSIKSLDKMYFLIQFFYRSWSQSFLSKYENCITTSYFKIVLTIFGPCLTYCGKYLNSQKGCYLSIKLIKFILKYITFFEYQISKIFFKLNLNDTYSII